MSKRVSNQKGSKRRKNDQPIKVRRKKPVSRVINKYWMKLMGLSR